MKQKYKEYLNSSYLLYLGLMANILVICGVLGGSLFIQVFLGEFPCPLCMVQRMAMMLCALGQAYILCRCNPEGRIDWKNFAIGHSLTLFAALAGSAMSVRQILLHIVPPDPGYGSAIFGLHMYTWGLILFIAEVLAVALNLIIAPRDWKPFDAGWKKASHVVLGLLAVIIFFFIIATFIEEGFNWVLPDDPVENAIKF